MCSVALRLPLPCTHLHPKYTGTPAAKTPIQGNVPLDHSQSPSPSSPRSQARKSLAPPDAAASRHQVSSVRLLSERKRVASAQNWSLCLRVQLPPLSISNSGLPRVASGVAHSADFVPAGSDARLFFSWARQLGYSQVQLDLTQPTLRPRELDGSARRDIAKTIAREGLQLSGVDLFIPPGDFADAARVDRATSAVLAAIECAAELRGGCVVSLVLPAPIDVGVLRAVGSHAERFGVRVADHAWPAREVGAALRHVLGVGIDPAAMMVQTSGKADGVAIRAREIPNAVAKLHTSPIAARWSEACAVGRLAQGDRASGLDVLQYAAVLDARGYEGALVVDLRSVMEQSAAARGAVKLYGELIG